MLFESGSPNLVQFTRFLAGDPDTAANPLFTDTEVKDMINLVYLELRDQMRDKDIGHTVKRSYTDTVADQIFYQLPVDFVSYELLEVETTGQDLSSVDNTSASISYLTSGDEAQLMELYHEQSITDPERFFIHDNYIGIVAPVETAGTNSMRLTYAASSPYLVNITDEPDIPRPHHPLICYEAAYALLASKSLPADDIAIGLQRRKIAFDRSTSANIIKDPERTIGTAGLVQDTLRQTKFGTVRKLN